MKHIIFCKNCYNEDLIQTDYNNIANLSTYVFLCEKCETHTIIRVSNYETY